MIFATMLQHLYRQILQTNIVATDNFLTPLQQSFISIQLYQSHSRHNICHIAFVITALYIIFPCPQLGFGQGILILSMQRQQLILLVQVIILNAVNMTPSGTTTLCGSKILDSMKGKTTKICNRASHLSMPLST